MHIAPSARIACLLSSKWVSNSQYRRKQGGPMFNVSDWIKQDKTLLWSFPRCLSQPRCIQSTLGHLAIMDMPLLQTESTSLAETTRKCMETVQALRTPIIVEFETLYFLCSWTNIFSALSLLHKTTWTLACEQALYSPPPQSPRGCLRPK